MSEQTFADAVRESRVFYRRALAERLAIAQIRRTGGVDAAVVVRRAAEITSGLEALESATAVAAVDPSEDSNTGNPTTREKQSPPHAS